MSDPEGKSILGYRRDTRGRALKEFAIPIEINGTATRVINFPAEFDGYAVDVLIDNRDTVNALTFTFNGRGTAVKTLSADGSISLGDTQVYQIEILAGSTNWEVTANHDRS